MGQAEQHSGPELVEQVCLARAGRVALAVTRFFISPQRETSLLSHLALDALQSIDMALGRSIGPGQGQSSAHSSNVPS
jgi:hypothetical protein